MVKYISDCIGVMYFGKLVELVLVNDLYYVLLYFYIELFLFVILLLDLNYECICVCKIYDLMFYNYKDGDEIKMCEIVFGYFVYCLEEEEVMYKEKYVKLIVEVVVK